MDASLIWEIVGSAAGVIATVFGYLQLRQGSRHTVPRGTSDAEIGNHSVRAGLSSSVDPQVAGTGRLGSRGESHKLPDIDARASPIDNLPTRNKGFTGRSALLTLLRGRLSGDEGASVQVLRGMGGVGKTQLALEYAYRFASDYDTIWWITAEQQELIGPQAAALAVEIGCASPGAETASAVRAILAELRDRDRWLLIFDNVSDPTEMQGWLPGSSTGHVIITSRSGGWDEISAVIEVDVFDRVESAAVLQARVPHLAAEDASSLAAALGDLPLAVAQAARYLAETGIPVAEYMDLLSTRAAEILSEGRPVSYPLPLDAATRLAYDRLRSKDAAAAELLMFCAFLAPEPVPAWMISAAAKQFPEPLATEATDPVALRRILAAIGQSALGRVGDNALHMHRLTQAIIRGSLTTQRRFEVRALSEAMIIAAHPGDRGDPVAWPSWAQFLPHLLAIDPGSSANTVISDLACEAIAQLWRRGDTRGTYELASKLHQQWRERLAKTIPTRSQPRRGWGT